MLLLDEPLAEDMQPRGAPVQVPGGYKDSLSSNTELGRAVRDACDELSTLR